MRAVPRRPANDGRASYRPGRVHRPGDRAFSDGAAMIGWPKPKPNPERLASILVGHIVDTSSVGFEANDDKGRRVFGLMFTPEQAEALADDIYRAAALARQAVQ